MFRACCLKLFPKVFRHYCDVYSRQPTRNILTAMSSFDLFWLCERLFVTHMINTRILVVLEAASLITTLTWLIQNNKNNILNQPTSWGVHLMMYHTYAAKIVKWLLLDNAQFVRIINYRDMIMSAVGSQITGVWLCVQPFVKTQIKENIQAPRHWPLWGESTSDRWNPRTKGR